MNQKIHCRAEKNVEMIGNEAQRWKSILYLSREGAHEKEYEIGKKLNKICFRFHKMLTLIMANISAMM